MFSLTPEEIEAIIAEEQLTPDPHHSEAYRAIADAALRRVAQELLSPCPMHFRNGPDEIECLDCLQQLKTEARLVKPARTSATANELLH